MVETLQGLMPHVPALLPPDITSEQFRAALYLELKGRPALEECTQESLRDCVIKAATFGLLPGRDVHFLPFANKRRGNKKEATYVPNYFGLILALERTGKIRRAFAHPVHEGDAFHFDMFADRPRHEPAETLGRVPGKELFYYGAVMFTDGTCACEVVSLDDLEAIRHRSPAHESGPWVTDTVMMRRKSALKRVIKYVRLTPQLRQMLDEDEAREREDMPPARLQQTVTEVFGEPVNPTAPPARVEPTAPAGEAGRSVTAQIEALILAHGGQVEPWMVWAERTLLGKPRTTFTVPDLERFLQVVRERIAKNTPLAAQESPTGTTAPEQTVGALGNPAGLGDDPEGSSVPQGETPTHGDYLAGKERDLFLEEEAQEGKPEEFGN